MQLILLAACGGAPPPPSGTILLVSERPSGPAAWAVSADGASARPLPDLPGAEFPGPPDPLGTHVLLVSAEDGPGGHTERLWLAPLAADGAAVPLSPPSGVIRNPSWAPDGSYVIFESDVESFRDLYRVERSGGPAVRLTDQPNGSFEPDISADQRVALGASRDGNAEIYVMAADGSAPVRLTDHPGDDVHPRWSPDGRTLAWIAHRDGVPRVWLMAADGSGARPLRSGAAGQQDIDQAWSPDGSRLAVVVRTVRQGAPPDVSIQVIEVESGRTAGVIDGTGNEEHPAWSPDGSRIAFTSGQGARAQVRLATPEGVEIGQIGAGGEVEWLPRWVPAR